MWKKIGLGFLAVLVAAVAVFGIVEGRNWPFWYMLSRYMIIGQESTAVAMDTRKPLILVPGDPRPLPGGEDATANDDPRFADIIAEVAAMDGHSLLIWQGGELLVERYFDGHDRELRPAPASMHKSVIGLLYTIAIGDGDIAPEDRIGEYIPEWADDPRGDITVDQFLHMSTGIEPLSWTEGMPPAALQFQFGRNMREVALGQPAAKPPGQEFHYMNTNSQILGFALEAATGEPYEDYLSEKLWQPLGAADAYLWPDRPGGTPRTSHGFFARPLDWLRLGLLIKDNGRFDDRQILPPAQLQRMLTPSETNPNYGWQIWLGTEFDPERHYNDAEIGFAVTSSAPFEAPDMVYFDGFGGQRVYISRALDLVIVRTGEARNDWDDAALPNQVIEALELMPQAEPGNSTAEAPASEPAQP